MNHSHWQLNPAISIEHDKSRNTLQIGLMSPNCYEITDECDQLLQLIQFFIERKVVEKEELLKEIAGIFTTVPESIFHDLEALKLIRPAIDMESRYARHELYFGFSGASTDTQENLARKSVLLIGAGGIGSTCAMLLAAAGVGELILADSDALELSNLTRTTLFELSDLGKSKVETAANRLRLRNPNVQIRTLSKNLNEESVCDYEKTFGETDVVVLSGDSGPEVHEYSYVLSKKYQKPLINAGYIEHCGVVGPLTIGENSTRTRDLLAVSGASTQVNRAYKAASFGPLNALVSSIAVNEVIRFLSGQEVQTLNRRLVIDSYNYCQNWEEFP